MKRRTAQDIMRMIGLADVAKHLGDLGIDRISEFSGTIEGCSYTARDASGGFGLPAVIVTVDTPHGRIDLGLMEKDGEEYSGEQDGSAPLEVNGWLWRTWEAGRILSEDWSDRFHGSAAEALHEAILAVAD